MASLHWISSVPLGAAIAVLGLIGNLISMVVWHRISRKNQRGNTSTTTYLLTLAIVDSGLLVSFLLSDTIPSNHPMVKATFTFASFFSYVGYPLFYFFIVASIWIIVGVTINRFIMVCFPTKATHFYTKKRTLLSIAAILGFCFLINIPHFLVYHPKKTTSGGYMLESTEFGKGDGIYMYDFWVHCIFLVLAPWLTIAVLNSLIIHKLVKQSRKFSSLKGIADNAKHHQERQMTITLLVITFAFLVLLAWQCVTQCFWMLAFGKTHDPSAWKLVDDSFAFAKLGIVINSSINCVLYSISGAVFRKEMMGLFIKRRRSWSSSKTSSKRSLRTEESLAESSI